MSEPFICLLRTGTDVHGAWARYFPRLYQTQGHPDEPTAARTLALQIAEAYGSELMELTFLPAHLVRARFDADPSPETAGA